MNSRHRAVWRFVVSDEVQDGPVFVPSMDRGDRIVHFGRSNNDGNWCVWAIVDHDTRSHTPTGRTFRWRGTGHNVFQDEQYVGTAMNGPFVWHLFEEVDT